MDSFANFVVAHALCIISVTWGVFGIFVVAFILGEKHGCTTFKR